MVVRIALTYRAALLQPRAVGGYHMHTQVYVGGNHGDFAGMHLLGYMTRELTQWTAMQEGVHGWAE